MHIGDSTYFFDDGRCVDHEWIGIEGGLCPHCISAMIADTPADDLQFREQLTTLRVGRSEFLSALTKTLQLDESRKWTPAEIAQRVENLKFSYAKACDDLDHVGDVVNDHKESRLAEKLRGVLGRGYDGLSLPQLVDFACAVIQQKSDLVEAKNSRINQTNKIIADALMIRDDFLLEEAASKVKQLRSTLSSAEQDREILAGILRLSKNARWVDVKYAANQLRNRTKELERHCKNLEVESENVRKRITGLLGINNTDNWYQIMDKLSEEFEDET